MNRREALRKTASITGMALGSSVTLGLLESCQPSGKPTWPPIFLKQNEITLITALSDTILPKTTTAGALDVHVPEFIDLMLRDMLTDEEKMDFREGLQNFVKSVDEATSNLFEDCSKEEKIRMLNDEEGRSAAQFAKTFKKSFYQVVKELTLLGYFSSETVMKNQLDYHPVPGRQEGCIPFAEGGKVFVDNNV